MKLIFWISALLFSMSVIAQEDSEKESKKTDYSQTKDYITFNVLPIFDRFAPRYGFGYIHRFTEKWAAGIDISYGNDALKIDFTDLDIIKSFEIFEIAPQVYHTFNPGRKVEQYVSAKLLYLNQSEVFINSYYSPKNDHTQTAYDQANYKRIKLSAYLNYGIFINVNNRFGINPYAGLGIRNRKNSYSNVVNPSKYFNTPTDGFLFWDDYFRDEGRKKGGVDFVLGVKLYFRLN